MVEIIPKTSLYYIISFPFYRKGEINMKYSKLFGVVGLSVMSCGLIFGSGLSKVEAGENMPERLDKIKTNKTVNDGDFKYGKPLKVYISESTGVRVEVHAQNAVDAKGIRKERGWTDNEPVEIIQDKKDSAKTNNFIEPKKNLSKTKNFIEPIKNRSIMQPLGVDTSGWDLVGSEYWTVNFSYSWYYDTIWHSHGGDYEFVIPAHSQNGQTTNPYGRVQLFESDPSIDPDEFVAEWDFAPSKYNIEYIVRGISNFVDGDDNLAEFYTYHKSWYATSSGRIDGVKYYD